MNHVVPVEQKLPVVVAFEKWWLEQRDALEMSPAMKFAAWSGWLANSKTTPPEALQKSDEDTEPMTGERRWINDAAELLRQWLQAAPLQAEGSLALYCVIALAFVFGLALYAVDGFAMGNVRYQRKAEPMRVLFRVPSGFEAKLNDRAVLELINVSNDSPSPYHFYLSLQRHAYPFFRPFYFAVPYPRNIWKQDATFPFVLLGIRWRPFWRESVVKDLRRHSYLNVMRRSLPFIGVANDSKKLISRFPTNHWFRDSNIGAQSPLTVLSGFPVEKTSKKRCAACEDSNPKGKERLSLTNSFSNEPTYPRHEARIWAVWLLFGAIFFFAGSYLCFLGRYWLSKCGGFLLFFFGFCCLWLLLIGAKDWI